MLTTRNLSTLDRMLPLDRVFDQAFGSSLGARVWVPAMDVAERKDAYVVQAELPGLSPEQVDVSFEKNVLTISGTKPASFDASADGELRIFAAERVVGVIEILHEAVVRPTEEGKVAHHLVLDQRATTTPSARILS